MNPVSTTMSGMALGLSIAAPVGPMGLLCINRTVNHGLWAGISTGAGATTVQISYCCIFLLSLDGIGSWLDRNHDRLNLCGAAMMIFFAGRLVLRRRSVMAQSLASKQSLFVAYGSAVLFNATNPVLILLLLGGVASIFDANLATELDIELLLVGLFFGSFSWWVCLSGVTAMLSVRANAHALIIIDRIIAAVLFAFGTATVGRVTITSNMLTQSLTVLSTFPTEP